VFAIMLWADFKGSNVLNLGMKTVVTPSGKLAYQKHGEGPAVLLLQGVGVVSEGWRPQIEGLRDRFCLIAPDNRGIGQSENRDGHLSIEAMADDALAIMDAEGIERFAVVGHSMGGLIAQAVACKAPERVTSLALLCTFARGKHAMTLSPGMIWLGLRSRVGTRRMRRNAFLQLVMTPQSLLNQDREALAAHLSGLFGHDIADQPPIVMKQLRACARFDVLAQLRNLPKFPTLVLSAQYDRIASVASGQALAAAIPGARFQLFPDAAHGVPIERADEINTLLAKLFVSGTGADDEIV